MHLVYTSMTNYNIPYPSCFKSGDGTSVLTTFNLMLDNVKTESYINHVLCVEKNSKPLYILGFYNVWICYIYTLK
jgi:hypothetical protein